MGSGLQCKDPRIDEDNHYTNNLSNELSTCPAASQDPEVAENNLSQVGMRTRLIFKESSTKAVYDQLVASGSIGDGVPAFVKQFTDSLCTGSQPIHISRKIVRKYLHPIGSPTDANFCFGDGKPVECIIKWGDQTFRISQ
ncbi:hypothetical protein ACFE04_014184 [Oxalis oulophora]